jgi:predicted ATPase/class 3 adenylate cyclase
MEEARFISTFLFTDIEGSTRLWELEPDRMQEALAAHDRISRAVVEKHRGRIVKTTGDGMCAVFDDPLRAVEATLDFQQAIADREQTAGLELRARCGIHVGAAQRRDEDYFGNTLNRAARIMGAAHGGQVLLSQATFDLMAGRLPQSITLRELGPVRLRDLAAPERLYQLEHASLRHDFPALRSLERTPNNLPQHATSFVGREREQDEVAKALKRARLLTLVGVGGIGKTRLALQVAANLLDDYPDGVWFVELAAVADPSAVTHAIAKVLGTAEEPGGSLVDVVSRWAADKQFLLVLDNCEHLIAACAVLSEQLLRGAPGLKLLATSREPLRISAEVIYPVPTLGVPEPGKPEADATYSRYPAVRLFAERASAVLPSFALDARNGRTIADICRDLDGIPLAIELAAARVRAMPVETIAARLDDRFRLLSTGSRTALPRQQTLRALIDWSHDLLSAQEREVFRRLSVFAGGWTLEGAEAVCSCGEVDGRDVLELLTSLVDKSLVAVELDGARYRLLETIRNYGEEKLQASGEESAVRERHLDFYLAFAEAAESSQNGPDRAAWRARLDLEQENLLSAHSFCGSSAEAGAKGLRLANSMQMYWFRSGLLPMGKRVMKEALLHPGAQVRDKQRSVALSAAGLFCSFAGEYDEAVRFLDESLAIARDLGDSSQIIATLESLGFAELGRGRVKAARGHAEEALALARKSGDQRKLASAVNAVAQMHRADGDVAAAEPLYDEVVTLGRRLDDIELVAYGLLNLAMTYVARAAYDDATRALKEIIAIARQTRSMPVGQSALEVASGLAASIGEAALALRFFGAAEANTRDTGIVRDPADDAFLQPLVQSARSSQGADAAAQAERDGREAGYEVVLGEVEAWLNEDR